MLWLFLIRVGWNPNIPLLNSFFLVHPLLLYTTIGYLIYTYLTYYKLFNKLGIYIFYISLFLGGVWSIQEFNWGGWWNWDLLEVFILFNICYLTYVIHMFGKFFNIFKHSFSLVKSLLFIFLYFVCNKWGLSISIHSFSKSLFFKNYFYYYFGLVLSLGFFFITRNLLIIINFVTIAYVYFYLTNLIFLKFLFVYLYFYYKSFWSKNNLISTMHTITTNCLLVIIFLNFFNNIFYIIVFTHQNVCSIFLNTVAVKWLLVKFSNIVVIKAYCSFFFFKLNSYILHNYLLIYITNNIFNYCYTYYYYIPLNFYLFFLIRK